MKENIFLSFCLQVHSCYCQCCCEVCKITLS